MLAHPARQLLHEIAHQGRNILAALAKTGGIIGRQLLRGQTNFAKMIWKFNDVYNADRQYAEHQQQARYLMPQPVPSSAVTPADRKALYVHATAPVHRS